MQTGLLAGSARVPANKRITQLLATEPRSLRDPDAVMRRRSILDQPHIAPLRDFAQSLRHCKQGMVPDFDPLDGGVDAKVLFLMEKPGPMTDDTKREGRTGSGFVSRDNDDPTAEAVWRFMAEAGIDRNLSVLWNVIPWWNGTREITRDECDAGKMQLSQLLDLLPRLQVVVGVGQRAGKAKKLIVARNLQFIASAHPSPINRASRRSVWDTIPTQWAKALLQLN